MTLDTTSHSFPLPLNHFYQTFVRRHIYKTHSYIALGGTAPILLILTRFTIVSIFTYGLTLAAGVGQEHRLGRWWSVCVQSITVCCQVGVVLVKY